MIISSAGLFSIGSSGLKAADEQIRISSNNIANSNTVGFTRSDAVYTERAIRAGVDVAAVNSYDVNLERAKNDAANAVAFDGVAADAMAKLSNGAMNAGVGESWSNFVGAVYDFRMKGDPTASKKMVDGYGQQVADSYNKWKSGLDVYAIELKQQISADQARATQLQVQISTTQDATTKNALTEELSSIQGKLQGMGEVALKVIPNLKSAADVAMDAAVQKVNSEMGVAALSRNTGGDITYNSNAVTGQVLVSASITGDTIANAVSAVLQQLAMIQQQYNAKQSADKNQQTDLLVVYQKQVGVDVVSESLKVQRAQRMYEACSKCIQVENENLKTIIGIV